MDKELYIATGPLGSTLTLSSDTSQNATLSLRAKPGDFTKYLEYVMEVVISPTECAILGQALLDFSLQDKDA